LKVSRASPSAALMPEASTGAARRSTDVAG
jgi:hypothetical protein